MHTVPLTVLLEASSVLKQIKDMPLGTTISTSIWCNVMYAQAHLQSHLDLILKSQEVAVTNTAKGDTHG